MSEYIFNTGLYFFSALVIAFVLAIVSVWWNRSPIFKAVALIALAGMMLLVFLAVNEKSNLVKQVVSDFRAMMNDLLGRPKPITIKALQDMVPEGHIGHLVLYGEVSEGGGIYLLLRSPNQNEPRYYLLQAGEKLREQFKAAKLEARNKNTQLFLGGKLGGKRSSVGNEEMGQGRGNAKKGGNRDFGDRDAISVFHPAPVSGGPEKTERPQDQPIVIPTPYLGR